MRKCCNEQFDIITENNGLVIKKLNVISIKTSRFTNQQLNLQISLILYYHL